ncbi:MAG: hypothetical protein LJE94_18645 [Deltaproteobacteria bacterium]|nr:hypothetical protein [Deltaproteobacteria bacterium]
MVYDLNKLEALIARKRLQDSLIDALEKVPLGLNAIYFLQLKSVQMGLFKWSG